MAAIFLGFFGASPAARGRAVQGFSRFAAGFASLTIARPKPPRVCLSSGFLAKKYLRRSCFRLEILNFVPSYRLKISSFLLC